MYTFIFFFFFYNNSKNTNIVFCYYYVYLCIAYGYFKSDMYRVWSAFIVSLFSMLIWLYTLIVKTNSLIIPELFAAGEKKQAGKTAEDNQNFLRQTFETCWSYVTSV